MSLMDYKADGGATDLADLECTGHEITDLPINKELTKKMMNLEMI